MLSPLARDERVRVASSSHPRVSFEELPPHRPAGLEARLLALLQAGYLESGITESVQHPPRRRRRPRAPFAGLAPKHLLAKAVVAPSLVQPATRYDVIDRLVSHPPPSNCSTRIGRRCC